MQFAARMWLLIYRASQEERSIFWEVMVSGILSKKVYMYVCPIPNGFRDRAISMYSSKTVAKKEILRTVSNTAIYCSSDKVGTVYIVIPPPTSMHFATRVRTGVLLVWTLYSVLYSEIAVSRKPFGIGHMYIYTFLLRMPDTMTSQNIDLSSWDTRICINNSLY
jgi:hypothetical protein